MPDNLMLDPSLFLSRVAFPFVLDGLKNGELKTARIPVGFATALREGELNGHVRRFFGGSPQTLNAREIMSGIREMGVRLPEPYAQSSSKWQGSEFESNLRAAVKDNVVRQILMEEWDFLDSQSWIAAKTRKAFNTFMKGGAAAIEWGTNKFDYLAARTLKIPPESIPDGLKPRQRLRAAAKWIAVGGSSASVLLTPPVAIATTSATGYFLIFDP